MQSFSSFPYLRLHLCFHSFLQSTNQQLLSTYYSEALFMVLKLQQGRKTKIPALREVLFKWGKIVNKEETSRGSRC